MPFRDSFADVCEYLCFEYRSAIENYEISPFEKIRLQDKESDFAIKTADADVKKIMATKLINQVVIWHFR
ncbi:MAG: hypothetical protein JXQ82_10460 [Methanomicrobiaceae archaeon]|nr:hypothetical protein [Methanomicrobiaceae archaeon]